VTLNLLLSAAEAGPSWLGVPAGTLGAGGLLGVCVLLILTGRLVPRSQVKAAEARADRWEAVAVEALRQNGQLVEGAQVTVDVVRAFPAARQQQETDAGRTP